MARGLAPAKQADVRTRRRNVFAATFIRPYRGLFLKLQAQHEKASVGTVARSICIATPAELVFRYNHSSAIGCEDGERASRVLWDFGKRLKYQGPSESAP
jgi:hypothetical protein